MTIHNYSVRNHLLLRNGRPVDRRATNKQNANPLRPLFVVVHYTVGEDFEAMTRLLSSDPARKASVHLVVGQAGEVAQIGTFADALWHAGKSSWVHGGRTYRNLNASSIGIEVCCRGWLNETDGKGRWRQNTRWQGRTITSRWYEPHEVRRGTHPNGKVAAWLGDCGWQKFTHAQMEALDGIIEALKQEYGILEVVGHDDICPERKQDPGHCMDRAWFDYWNGKGARPGTAEEPAVEEMPDVPVPDFAAPLTRLHGSGFRGSVRWRLTARGLEVAGTVPRTAGPPATVERIWREFGASMVKWAEHYKVPVELLVMTAAVETAGHPDKVREEPGYISDNATPERVSPGLMQTLIATARWILNDQSIDREWLLVADNSIKAAAAYMDWQRKKTNLDPPLVGAGYNAGSIRHDRSKRNRWKLVVHPKGTGAYCDAVVEWFNDCFAMFEANGGAPEMSFYRAMNPKRQAVEPPPVVARPKSLWALVLSLLKTLISRR